MRIIVDTREQAELKFEVGGAVTAVLHETVPVGDYWCEYEDGSRPPVFFERKSVADLFSTFGAGHKRFMREIALAGAHGFKLVLIVEAPLGRIYEGYGHSSIAGSSIAQKAFTLWVRHGLMPVFCQGRDDAAQYILETYLAIGRCWKAKGQPLRDLMGGLQMPLHEIAMD